MIEPVLVFGIPVDFILFALTLLGVALFHHKTLQVALAGLAAIIAYKLVFTGFGGSATGDISFTTELVSPASIDEPQSATGRLIIQPDPAEDATTLLIADLPPGTGTLTLADMTGRMLRHERITIGGGLTQYALDLQGMSAGSYCVRVESTERAVTGRLIVR